MSTLPTIYAQNAFASRSLRVAMAVDQSHSHQTEQTQANHVNVDKRISRADQTNQANQIDQADTEANINKEPRRNKRLPSWQQKPGISVSITSQSDEHGIDTYRNLRSDGRRKGHVQPQENTVQSKSNINSDFSIGRDADETRRKSGPQSNVLLNNFIHQMMGIETPPIPGANINVTV